MRYILLPIFICLNFFLTTAQEAKKADESKIDGKTQKSVNDLALYLTKDVSGEEAKVKAIHHWITNNIAYDYKLIESDKSFQYESASKVLKSKKALCTGYVRLMREMLDAVGIQAVYVPGYTYAHKAFYQPKVLLDNHAWITIKIDGEWKMADPTWDAGYIGSLEAEKVRLKLKKKNEKIDKKNLKLKESEKDTIAHLNIDSLVSAKNPTGKIGFVFNPSEDWFLIDEDEFLLRHLPANPMWQLRKKLISVPNFLMADSTLEAILKDDNIEGTYDFESKIDTFLSLPFIEQVAFLGTDAYDFYSENKRVKAYYYYYFLSIIHDKEIQDQIKEFDLAQTYRLKRMVNQITDSTLHYAKLGEKVEKERYKALEGFYKTIDKTSQANGKYFVKMGANGLKWNMKLEATLEKSLEKLPTQIEKLQGAGGQYYKEKELEFVWPTTNVPENVQILKDSTFAIKNRWQKAVDVWTERVENSPFQEVYQLTEFNNYLLRRRLVFLGHKSISFNDYVDRVDFLVRHNLDTITNLFALDIKEETLLDNAYKAVKELDTYLKTSLLELSKSALSDDEKDYAIGYLNKVLSHMQSQQLVVAEGAYEHNQWMLGKLNQFQGSLLRFERLAEDQEKLTLEKNEYLVEHAELEHKREEDLADVIQKKVKIWQLKNK